MCAEISRTDRKQIYSFTALLTFPAAWKMMMLRMSGTAVLMTLSISCGYLTALSSSYANCVKSREIQDKKAVTLLLQ